MAGGKKRPRNDGNRAGQSVNPPISCRRRRRAIPESANG